jgi:hypothetical protein
MKKIQASITLLLTLMLVFWGTASWGQSERKVAKMFVQEAPAIHLTVKGPSFLYKYNRKTGILDTIPYHNQREKDSILWVHSDFIQHIADSIFIRRFMKGYRSELKKYGFQLGDNPSNGSVYQVDVEQIEIEEQYYFYSDTALFDEDLYVHRQFLNALDVSAWFKIKGPLVKSKEGKVLFAENLLTDNLDGHFDLNPYTGQIRYLYKLDSLTVKKIYNYAQNLGRTYAGYTFDYLLNAYLNSHVSDFHRSKRYWRYDPYRQKFFFALDDRFVPLNNH